MTYLKLHKAMRQAHETGTRADIWLVANLAMKFGMSIGAFIPENGGNHDQVACCLTDAVERGDGQDDIRAHNAGVKDFAG